jgi:predicted RNA-binding Zn ribbon-like protein
VVAKIRKAGNLELLGGPLCLNFTNTVNTRISSLHHDYLAHYTDLIEWGRHVGILSESQTKYLEQEAIQDPAKASEILNQAIALRETIYRIFVAFARQKPPATADINALNAEIKRAFAKLHIAPFKKGLQWDWDRNPQAMDLPLFPIVKSAADLLTSDELPKVKQCANREHCDWMFLDTSKNQSRRWCCMSVCGSRHKSRQYYRRKRTIP